MPKLHIIIAPVTAHAPIAHDLSRYFFEPFTDPVRVPPVVVTKQITLRSSSDCQLRADGSRYVKNRLESR
jgi:hypothetical protein